MAPSKPKPKGKARRSPSPFPGFKFPAHNLPKVEFAPPRSAKPNGEAHSTDQLRPSSSPAPGLHIPPPYNPPKVEFARAPGFGKPDGDAKPNGEARSADQPRPSSSPAPGFKFSSQNPSPMAFGAPPAPGSATSAAEFDFSVAPTEGQFKRLNDLLIAENKRLKAANEKYYDDNTKLYGQREEFTKRDKYISSLLEGEQAKNHRLENEVEKLDKDKARLENDLDDFREEHDVAMDKCAAAELSEKTATEQLRGARYLRDKAEREKADLLKRIKRAEDQVGRAKKVIETLKPTGPIQPNELMKRVQQGLAEANDLVENTEEERDRFQLACGELEKCNEFLEKNNTELEAEKVVLSEEIEQLKTRVEEFEDGNCFRVVELTRLTGESNRFQADNEELRRHRQEIIDERNKTVETMSQQIAKITAEREDFDKQAEKFVNEQRQLVEANDLEIARITAEREEFGKEAEKFVNEQRQLVESKDLEIARITAERQSVAKAGEQGDAEKFVNEQRQLVEAKDQEIARITAEREEFGKEAEKFVNEQRQLVESKDLEIARIAAECQSTTKAGEQGVRETNETIATHDQAELAKLRADLRSLSEQHEALKKEGRQLLRMLKERNVAQNKRIAQLEAACKNGSKEVGEAIEERNQISQLEAACENYDQLDGSKDFEEAIEERNKMIEAKDQEIARLTDANKEIARLTDANKEIARLTDANKNAESHYNSLQKRAEEIVAERDNQIQEQATTIEDQRRELSNAGTSFAEYQTLVQAKESEIAALKSENIKAAATIGNRAGDMDNCYETIRDLQAAKKVLETENSELKAARTVETSSLDAPDQESGTDMEIQQKLAALESALTESRAQETAQKNIVTELQSQCKELSETLAASKTNFEAIVQGCERQIESQKKEMAEVGAACDAYREMEQALSNELADLKQQLQELSSKAKASAALEKQLERAIEDRDATIRGAGQTIEGLKHEAQDLKALIKIYEEEQVEAKNLWKGKETKREPNLGEEKRKLIEFYEKRLADQEEEFKKKLHENEEDCEEAFWHLDKVQGELMTDVNKLERYVEELREKTKGLEHELESCRKDAKTKDEDTDRPNGPLRDYLGRFSTSVSPMGVGQRGRVEQPRRRRRERWGSDSEDTDDEEPIPRLRRQISDELVVSMGNASTQTDNPPRTSDCTTQTTSSSEPAVAEVSIQAKPSKRYTTSEMATQTERGSISDVKRHGQPEIKSEIKLEGKPSVSSAETQTVPRKKAIPLWWRLLYYLLLCLIMLAFSSALWLCESARRERAMWREANDYTRRAAFSVLGGGGTGMWKPAWFWREPLVEMSTRYY
ncbi:MAG: hypothetical protein Q9173_003863 [Seirophora scorigena]